MKVKLLFTAAFMTAASMATQNVFAGQGLSFGTALMASASPDGETEDTAVSDETTDYTSRVKNASCSNDTQDWWKPSINASANNVVNNAESKNRAGVEYWTQVPTTEKDVIRQTVTGLPAGQYKISALILARTLSATEDKGVYLKGNGVQTAVLGISGDWNATEVTCDVDESGKLDISLYAGVANESDWLALSEVQLSYLNNYKSLTMAIAAAQALQTSLGAEDETLSNAISTAQAVKEGLTATEYKTAIETLQSAMDEYLGNNASASNAYDMTDRILNPDFTEETNKCSNNSQTDYHGWYRTWTGGNQQKSGSLVEYWNNTFEHSQELSNLPNGKYKVEVLARHFGDGGYLFATSAASTQTAPISQTTISGTTLAGGNLGTEANNLQSEIDGTNTDTHSRISLEILVTDGTLKIGMKSDATGSWIVFRDFRLSYEGIDLTALQTLRDDLVAEAQEITEGSVPAAVYNQLQAAITHANAASTAATLNENNASLRVAIDTAKPCVAPYSAYVALKNDITSIRPTTTASETANETLDAAIALADNVANATTATEITQIQEELNTAWENYLSNAQPTEGNTIDLTFKVQNPTCTANTGWQKNSANKSASYNVNSAALNSDDYSGIGIEYYNNPANSPRRNEKLIWQTVNNLQAGEYKVTAVAMGRNQGNGDVCEGTLNLIANDGTGAVTTNVWGTVSANGVVSSNGELTIGLSAGGDNANNWVAISQVKLEYLGLTLAAMKDAYETKVEERQAAGASLEGQIPAAYVTILNGEAETFDTAEEYSQAITDVEAQIETANELVAPYAAFNKLKTDNTFKVFVAETTAPEANKTAINAAWETSVETATTVNEINDAIAQIRAIQTEYTASVTGLAEGVPQTDVTFLVGNTTFEGTTAPWTNNVSGGHNFNVMNPNANDLGRGIRFIESYVYCDQVVNNANKKLVYQTLNGMPKGNYTFEAASFNRRANFGTANTAEDPNAIIMYVNNGKIEVNSTTFSETLSSVNGNSVDGTVEFGLASGENFNTDWNGLADVHLYYKGVPAVELSEENAYDVTEDTYANVALNRTLKANDKWNTFCVPFDMPTDEFSAVKKLTAASTEGETTLLTFEDATSIEAGVPYIVKVDAEKTSLTVDGVVVKAAAPEALSVTDTQGNTISMLGNYATTTLNEGEFFISDNTFYIADRDVTVKGFRAYIKMDAAQTSEVNRMLIEIDGETTAIEDVMAGEGALADKIVDVYTISGIKVKANTKMSEALNGLSKGIYIVDGKKIIK